jgi:diguanylate cyclase (GGDEF)-like protein
MSLDGPTLYVLLIGTTFVASLRIFWERPFNRSHRNELTLWAAGLLLVSVGCLLRIAVPPHVPLLAVGLSNLAVCWGYALVALGIARLAGARVRKRLLGMLLLLSGAWMTVGYGQPLPFRIAATSIVVAALCIGSAAILWYALSSGRHLPSQRLAAGLFFFHGSFFLFRALVTGFTLGAEAGALDTNMLLAMFEGVLWSAVAPMTLLVLAREKSESQIFAVSQTDYLTDIDNRRAFFQKGGRALGEAPNDTASVTVLAFDLDHFKAINDRFGHAAGDEVLRLFAREARDILGHGAIFARLGGEEFAAIILNADLQTASAVATEIAERLAAFTESPNLLGIKATVSVGIAQACWRGADLSSLLSAADAALYRAKALGRDRIELAPPAPVPAFV